MAYKALIIGCGNIGALYDFDNDQVLTHAKAYVRHPEFDLTVFDRDKELCKKISTRYNIQEVTEINSHILSQFDCVSICTPTNTHTALLRECFTANVKLVVCEKPVADNIVDLKSIYTNYQSSNTTVLVNYIRRFQPAYLKLKNQIFELMQHETLLHVGIRYQRGFLNNCSHAFDLLSFVLGKEVDLTEVKILHKRADHFDSDPTITMSASWLGSNVSILGLSDVQYAMFEIDLYFNTQRIRILEAGQSIQWSGATSGEKVLKPLSLNKENSAENCLTDYMTPVIDKVYQLLEGSNEKDNFNSAVDLNIKMLQYKDQ